MISDIAFSNAQDEFDKAWQNPDHTAIELDTVDVNGVLEKYYATSEPLHFTKRMLWDMEAKKAWDPSTYIPHVVREGKSWGRKTLRKSEEFFVRSSRQLAWMTNAYGLVLEKVYLSHEEQKVIFLGRAEFLSEDGTPVYASSHQPLFHVEHAAGGTESRPLNRWRIVHLTTGKDDGLVQWFAQRGSADWLLEFIEIYIKNDLRIKLTHR